MAPRLALLLLLLAFAALVPAACGGGEVAAPTAEEVEGTVETDAETEGETAGETEGEGGATTEAEEGETGEAAGDAQAGRAVYDASGCGGCHVLEAAGSSGTAGPNLDESKPSFEEAVEQVRNGGGGMPAFKDQLSEEEIRNVSAFVTESAGG